MSTRTHTTGDGAFYIRDTYRGRYLSVRGAINSRPKAVMLSELSQDNNVYQEFKLVKPVASGSNYEGCVCTSSSAYTTHTAYAVFAASPIMHTACTHMYRVCMCTLCA